MIVGVILLLLHLILVFADGKLRTKIKSFSIEDIFILNY